MKPRMCICGTEPEITAIYDEETDMDMPVVRCPNCGRITPKKFSDKKAIVSWNISQTNLWAKMRNEQQK